MALLIKNGTVVNDDSMTKSDVLIVDEKIVIMEENFYVPENISNLPGFRIIDATDRFVIPGGIDPHTHMQLPFMGTVSADDFHQGTLAALSGGTTMIIDFAISSKNGSILEAYKQWRTWADPKVCCDYGLSVAIPTWNDQMSKDMELLVTPEYGVNSFKFYLAYKNALMVNDDEFFQGLKKCSEIGALARVHAENGHVIAEKEKDLVGMGITGPEGHTQSRPEELEAEATNRACVLASQANCPLYVVHVMSKEAARAISYHRSKGNVIFGEPIAAGLGCDGSHYYSKDWIHSAAYILSPPLSRDPSTPDTLMDLLACGELHLTGTDNCTYTCKQKELGRNDFTKIPNGINGVEDRMSVVWEKGVHSGKIDPMRFVAITSTTAARIFNMYPRKGRIAPGSDADVVIWNPKGTRTISAKTHHHAHDYNIFEGMTVHGVPEITISRGKVVWENGQLNVQPGSGKFVNLAPYCNYVFDPVNARAEAMKPISVDRGNPLDENPNSFIINGIQ